MAGAGVHRPKLIRKTFISLTVIAVSSVCSFNFPLWTHPAMFINCPTFSFPSFPRLVISWCNRRRHSFVAPRWLFRRLTARFASQIATKLSFCTLFFGFSFQDGKTVGCMLLHKNHELHSLCSLQWLCVLWARLASLTMLSFGWCALAAAAASSLPIAFVSHIFLLTDCNFNYGSLWHTSLPLIFPMPCKTRRNGDYVMNNNYYHHSFPCSAFYTFYYTSTMPYPVPVPAAAIMSKLITIHCHFVIIISSYIVTDSGRVHCINAIATSSWLPLPPSPGGCAPSFYVQWQFWW